MVVRGATADRIASAALGLFAVHGLAGAPMDEIRRAAGVSNGSLYHHFPSRADLAARLVVTGMADSQRVVQEALTNALDAQAGVRAVVAAQLGWVEEHPQLARLLFGELPDEVLLAAEPAFSTQNRDYARVVGGWLRAQAEADALVERSFEVAHALWLGPGQEFARHWLTGRTRQRPLQVVDQFADGAWHGLAAR